MTFDFDHHEFNIRLIEAVERAHKKPSFDGSKRDSVRRYQMWMSQLVRDVVGHPTITQVRLPLKDWLFARIGGPEEDVKPNRP